MRRGEQEAMVAGHVVAALVGRLDQQGLDARSLFRRYRIPASRLEGTPGHIPLRSYVAMLEDVAGMSGNPLFGLAMAREAGPETLGAVGFLFLSAANLGDGLDLLCRYSEAIQDRTCMRVEMEGPLATVVYQIADDLISPRRQDAEFSLGLVLRLVRTYLGRSDCAAEAHFEHAPGAPVEAYARAFGCPTYFNQPINAILLPAEMLARGARHPHAWIHPILEGQLHELIDRKRASLTFTDRVRDTLEPTALRKGVTAQRVAGSMGLSAATLHRRLKAENTGFQALLDQRRLALARRLLWASGSSIGDVAGALGYTEHAAFTRAFRRWTGLNPSEFRRRPRAQP